MDKKGEGSNVIYVNFTPRSLIKWIHEDPDGFIIPADFEGLDKDKKSQDTKEDSDT